ncbi:MAG: serine hydrolase, partial [Longimicrobiales bacterium]
MTDDRTLQTARARSLAAVLGLLMSAACAAPGAAAGQSPGQSPGRLLIRDALLVDGTGAPARRADVRVRGERIAQVGELTPEPGESVLDARGLALAPGFIDTHSHHDRGLLEQPDALAAVSQGITTIVVGNDGSSTLPLAGFFGALDSVTVAVNVASYAGHGSIRRAVMGDAFRRTATPAEVDAMRELLRREMQAGALGLSTGLEYDPGIYATTDEVVALAREAAAHGGRYISHIRSEDRTLWDAVDEAIRIGREAAIPVQIGHMKLAMKSLWGRSHELLARLERARASGVDVTADVYPYTYWQSTMTVLFPERDFSDRAVAEFALRELVPPEGMLIAEYEAEPSLEGRTLAEIARDRGEDPATTYMALIARARATGEDESIIATSMTEADVATLLRWEHTNVSSDGALHGGHPRGFGAFARVLGPLVRDGVLTLEDAVRKMTSLAAAHVGIEARGAIRPGAFADLVLFDPARVADRATPERPHLTSVGIERVWVNGVVVYEGASTTDARPGMIVRHATAAPVTSSRAVGSLPARQRAAVDSIFAAYDTRHTPGCAVGIYRSGRLAFGKGYGMADLEHDVPITTRSVFRTGSVGKQFTAAAIALLAQEGRLSLDDPVLAYLPELDDAGPGLTIRRLLHHTSGVRDYLTLMALAGTREEDWYSDDDALAIIARQPTTNFEPGAEHLYSNSGYFLLSQIVERVTGETLAEYADRRIFEPLGMRATHFHDDPTRIVHDRAIGYAPAEGGGFRISMTTLPMVGDGGVFTSIEELARWDANLYDGATVGGEAFVAQMHRRGVLTSGDTIDYALGLVHGQHRGLRTVGHGGAFVGFRAATIRFPDERVSVYTLCNRADAAPYGLGLRVADVVLAERVGPPVPDDAAAANGEEAATRDTLALAPGELAAYEGVYYADALGADYRIRLDGDTLRLELGNGLDGPLAPVAPDTFRRRGLTLRFAREAGRVTGFELDAGRVRAIRFERRAPVTRPEA